MIVDPQLFRVAAKIRDPKHVNPLCTTIYVDPQDDMIAATNGAVLLLARALFCDKGSREEPFVLAPSANIPARGDTIDITPDAVCVGDVTIGASPSKHQIDTLDRWPKAVRLFSDRRLKGRSEYLVFNPALLTGVCKAVKAEGLAITGRGPGEPLEARFLTEGLSDYRLIFTSIHASEDFVDAFDQPFRLKA